MNELISFSKPLKTLVKQGKIKKLINIDGKTIRGNRNKHQNPLHIVSAYSTSDGLFLGQLPTEEKSEKAS